MLGKKSSKASVEYKLEELKLGQSTDEQNAEILARVKQAGIAKDDILTDDEFKEIANAVM